MASDELISFQEFVFDDVVDTQSHSNVQENLFQSKSTKRLFIIRDISTETRKNIYDPNPFTTDIIPEFTLRALYSFISNSTSVCIVYSPLRRAVVTANVIKKLFPKIKFKEHEFFREVKTGFCDHFVGEEFVRDDKEEFFGRMKNGIEFIAKTIKETDIVLITHESFIVQMTKMHLQPGCFTRIDLDVS